MEGNTTQTTGEAASVVNPVDDIASLLMGEEEEQTGNEGQQVGPEETPTGETEGQQPEGEGEESGESAGGEGEQPEEDLTWAKALGVDDSQLVLDEEGNLKGIQVKVDGEVSTVGVKDLIAGYQLNKHVTQKSQALAEEKREFDTLRTQAVQLYTEKLQTADKMLSYMDQSLIKEFNGINWEQLRQQNPGEYAAMQEDFRSRKAMLQQIHTAIQEENRYVDQQKQAEYQKNYQAYLAEQHARVLAANPEWQNPERLQADITALGNFVTSEYGIAPEEFNALSDARYIEILKDAMAYKKGKTVVEKKLQNVPKIQKAGKTSKPMSKVTQLTLNAKKATGHKQRDLQRDAVAALLLGQS